MFKSFAVRINNICITKYNFAFWILASRRLAREMEKEMIIGGLKSFSRTRRLEKILFSEEGWEPNPF